MDHGESDHMIISSLRSAPSAEPHTETTERTRFERPLVDDAVCCCCCCSLLVSRRTRGDGMALHGPTRRVGESGEGRYSVLYNSEATRIVKNVRSDHHPRHQHHQHHHRNYHWPPAAAAGAAGWIWLAIWDKVERLLAPTTRRPVPLSDVT